MQQLETANQAFSPQWINRASAPSIEPVPGITIWPIVGEQIMLCLVRLLPGAELPLHHHVNEQAGTVVEGELILTIDGKTRSLHSGDAYVIPSNAPHSGIAGPHGCDVIDVFSPPREDYRISGELQVW